MFSKFFTSAIICLLLGTSNLHAQAMSRPCMPLPLPEMQHVDCACGTAYELATSTNKLLATVLVGTAVVAIVAIALWNTPNSHGHGHEKDHKHGSHHHNHHHHKRPHQHCSH